MKKKYLNATCRANVQCVSVPFINCRVLKKKWRGINDIKQTDDANDWKKKNK